MKYVKKNLFVSLISAAMLIQGFPGGGLHITEPTVEDEGKEDLIILQNVPQVEAKVENDKLELDSLKIQEEGHFTLRTKNVRWSTSNENVAEVDEEGTVTFTGRPGRAFIEVSDGTFKDRIALNNKENQTTSGSENRGSAGDDPSEEPSLVKESGERYNIISQTVESMTLEEKIGQMLMPDFRSWQGSEVTEMLPEIEKMVEEYHLGGVILFSENVVSPEQTAALVSDYQEAAEKFGLLMTIDQEGGVITRLQSGTDFPGNMALGAARSNELSFDTGSAIGEELKSLGINMNMAPVLDVNNNPDNPVIGVRSFSEDSGLTGDLGVSFTHGLQEAGVAATAKHFPGHGDTDIDSHLGLPEVPHDRERLLDVELDPFQKAMDEGIDAVMTAHVTFPEIDNTTVISEETGEETVLPATLSRPVLTGLMREEMEYEGVIITDAMNMQAIQSHFGPVDAAVRSVEAGADIILMPVGLEEVAEGLVEAVDSGAMEEDRIEASVERILELKINRGVIKEENPEEIGEKIDGAEQTIGALEHEMIEKEAAEQSITLVKNENVLPIEAEEVENIVVIGGSYMERFGRAIREHHPEAAVIEASSSGDLTSEEWTEIEAADQIIISTDTANVTQRAPGHTQMTLVREAALRGDASVTAVGIRNPYDIMAYEEEVDAYITQYGYRTASFEATAAVLFGENDPVGKLPVTIPDLDGNTLYEFGHGLTY
ncbi:glycoside hydrolase family 3 protein [Alkalicoccus halolimnae]|uniref:beta-N-acetylhexosaminidase n=1 Tax=Alkalicoccus halolimnae TaxID=1667239 RepID=A0AAJ8LWU7_9BACI|nr:glycoside hydrolase family 3 protein [Alkalicoccus halolimnae]